MTDTLAAPKPFELIAGELCLDFVNTLAERTAAQPIELLRDFEDLLRWLAQAGEVTDEEARALAQAERRDPGRAVTLLAKARELREALFRLFFARAEGAPLDAADIATLNRFVPTAYASLRLVEREGGFRLDRQACDTLDCMLSPIVRSAVGLLTGEAKGVVKQCAADDCRWMFLDVTKNKSRRWCDMEQCGNRAKARRHYARHRHGAQAQG